MRLTVILSLALSLQVHAKALSQTVSLSGRDLTVYQVFDAVKKQTRYLVFYDKALLLGAKPISIRAKNMPLQTFLSEALKNQSFDFHIENQTIFITKKVVQETTLFTSAAEKSPPPEPPVTGLVIGPDGKPLPGANILVKGTTRGTATNNDGKFSIEATADQTLVISAVGFIPQEIQIGSQTAFEIRLVYEDKSLNAIIVTALGISKSVKSLTYSAQDIKGDNLNKAKETNVVNALQGKVAGVTITKNATGPGGDSKVLIRGNRSITNSNEPLYVIDGVPLSGNIGMLNSDDIESMTILKGASAAALYGSQGQNGAIVITTKRAKAGETIVNYIGGISIERAAVLPELQFEYGQGDAGIYNASSEHSWGPKITGQTVELWNGHSVKMEGQPDRLKDYFRNGLTVNNAVSVQGGNEKMLAYVSYANTTAQGIMPNNDLRRHNLDFKITNNITTKFSIFTKLSYIYENVDNRVEPGDAGTYALPSIFRSPVTIPLGEMKEYTYIDASGAEKQSYWNPGSSVQVNPYWALNRVLYFQKRERLLGLVSLKYSFTNWLSLQLRGSLDKTTQNNRHEVYEDSYFSQVGSTFDLSENKIQGMNVDALLSFSRSIGKDFSVSGNVGASLQESKYESISEDANGLNKSNYFFMVNARSPVVINGYGRTPQVQSLYATATLGYHNNLYLDITARNDWSSALPEANQSYFYPSVGLSAILSDMLKMPSWVTYGKARVTFAGSGFGGTEYLDRNYYSVGPGGAILTPSIQSLGDYRPEITHSFETGLDWRFFKSRFGFNFTYYDTKTKDQLLLIGIPSATLFSQKYINAGLIRNSGVELTADVTPIKSSNFAWTAAVNYSKNNNKVERLTENMKSVIIGEGDAVYLIKVDEGSSFGDVYVRGWARDDKGRRLVDEDGSPTLTDGTNAFVGNYNPDWMLGFSNTFIYKAFSLSFLIDHRQGGVVISGTQALIDADGHSKESLRGREDGIVLDGVQADGSKNTVAVESQKYFGLIGGRYPIAEFYSYSGSNTRLRELVFTYTFSNSLLSKTKFIKKAEVSLVGRNLFFFQLSAPVDPEITRGVDGGGLEYAALPSTRSYGFNLNISF
ncbi:MAG TPA: SusC/RagA family TonB-linked outer membrane protein [Agriterribacter sp.]|nr:SusC/RagA family TonB-linked outer membrane protein [Agriterribacter sp.]